MRYQTLGMATALFAMCYGLTCSANANSPSDNDTLDCDVSVEFRAVKKTDGLYNLGTMDQRCNAKDGYRVIAEGGSALANAVMIVSGVPIQFDIDGKAVLLELDGPGSGSSSLLLQTQGNRPQSLSFRIEILT